MGSIGAVINDETGWLGQDIAYMVLTTADSLDLESNHRWAQSAIRNHSTNVVTHPDVPHCYQGC